MQIKNGAGTVELALKSDGSSNLEIDWPFGLKLIDGLETDVIDAGSVEYILG